MDDGGVRALVEQVKAGRLSRRQFTHVMAGFGLSAPFAAHILASAGVTAAEPRNPEWVPARRGGGGSLRVLMWDAPTMLHPHFGRGLRDFTVSRLFYEPLAVPSADGTLVPVLANEIPS